MSSLRGNQGPRYRNVADESAPYETVEIDKLTPIIGAEIGGIDLSQPLGNRTNPVQAHLDLVRVQALTVR